MSYVFAPTENGEKKNERNLRKIIEYIGSKQSGIGSNTSKGLRYIKTQLSCTNNAIKFLYKSGIKILNHDFEQYGVYVYKYNEYCRDILGIIIEYIPQYIEENLGDDCLHRNMTNAEKFYWLFSNQYRAIEWVENNNYKNQYEKANKILSMLECLK